MTQAQAKPGKTLLSPNDHTLIMIDHQSQMAFATKSIDAVLLRNNAALVAKAAREFWRLDDSDYRRRKELLRSDFRRNQLDISWPGDDRSDFYECVGGLSRHSSRKRNRKTTHRDGGSLDQRLYRRAGTFGA